MPEPAGLRIHHVALRVADPVASLAFYSGALGLPEVRRQEDGGRVRAIWVRAGDAVLMLERTIKGARPAKGSGHVLVLEATDLDEWVARLERAGHPLIDRTASTVYVADPDGHRVGLTTYPRERMIATGAAG